MRTNILLCGLAGAISVAAATVIAADTEIAPVTRSPSAAGGGEAVGVAKHDGVTVSGNEAFVTRNGVTEKLVKELRLPSGILVRPDGSVRIGESRETNLQADQLLTFDGRILTIPNDPNVNPALPAVAAPVVVETTEVVSSAAERSLYTPARTGSGSQGSVFLSGGGDPFIGTVTAPGIITTLDGTTVAIDGNIRAVTFGPGEVASVGRLNRNGAITTREGSTLFPDGSVRSANGTVISAPGTGRGAAVSASMMNAAGSSVQGSAAQRAIANQQGTTNQQGTSNQQGVTNQQGAVVGPQGTVNPGATGERGQFQGNAGGQFQGTNGNQGQFKGGSSSSASANDSATSRGSATGGGTTGGATGGGTGAAGAGRGGGGGGTSG